MSLMSRCSCGARLRFPDGSEGKKARCPRCHEILVIKASPYHPSREKPAKQRQTGGDSQNDWVKNFLDLEASGVPESPVQLPPLPQEAMEPAPDIETPPIPNEMQIDGLAVLAGFWRSLAGSFFFFLSPGNFITLILLVFIHLFLPLLGYAGILGAIGRFLVYGYLCSFYLSVIRETASGEDDLPSMGYANWFDDVLWPMIHFAGTWVVAFLPLAAVHIASLIWRFEVAAELTIALTVAGALLWPAIALIVAIGSGFGGLWPHVVVGTVVAAPIAYVSVCVMVAVTGFLLYLPDSAMVNGALVQSGLSNKPAMAVLMPILGAILSPYTTIITMRGIGLYYRHFKHKLPWSAE